MPHSSFYIFAYLLTSNIRLSYRIILLKARRFMTWACWMMAVQRVCKNIVFWIDTTLGKIGQISRTTYHTHHDIRCNDNISFHVIL
jgi:hypothetical protein